MNIRPPPIVHEMKNQEEYDMPPHKLAVFYLEMTGNIFRWQIMEKRRMMEIFLQILPFLEGELLKMVSDVIVALNRQLQHND